MYEIIGTYWLISVRGIVMSVYGYALLTMAEEQRLNLHAQDYTCPPAVFTFTGKRPHVNDRVPYGAILVESVPLHRQSRYAALCGHLSYLEGKFKGGRPSKAKILEMRDLRFSIQAETESIARGEKAAT